MSAGNFPGSARVSRVKASPARTFGVAPKQSFVAGESLTRRGIPKGKSAMARTLSPARETRALPG
jgi:hypothetical protein